MEKTNESPIQGCIEEQSANEEKMGKTPTL